MAEYTYKDVIIDPEDPRVEIGAEYYFALGAQACIEYANSGRRKKTLDGVDKSGEYNPFITDEKDYPFIIRKKEPEKRYVPFDLNNEEDRTRLRGAWVRIKDSLPIEQEITGLYASVSLVFLNNDMSVHVKNLLEEYEFVDGTPCGKLVEVDE